MRSAPCRVGSVSLGQASHPPRPRRNNIETAQRESALARATASVEASVAQLSSEIANGVSALEAHASELGDDEAAAPADR